MLSSSFSRSPQIPATRLATRCGALTLFLAILGAPVAAQAPGLRLFAPTGLHDPQMVDANGNIVHSWSGMNNLSVHMLDDGSLLRSGVVAGGAPGATLSLERQAFDGTVLWDFVVNTQDRSMHHDIEPMPNGNVLVIIGDIDTAAEAIAAGRDPALITGTEWLPDAILEIQPTGPTSGIVVWEWHMMDHVVQDFDPAKPNYGVVANHPELLDINYPPVLLDDGDWNHANGLDYDPINDWIVFSARAQNEIYLIDHSTTTAEAAGHTGGQRGHGGDLLYRWGNPLAYGAGTILDNWFRGQHDPRFVRPGYPGAGNITVFNNAYGPSQSAVHEIVLPLDSSGNIVLDPVTGRFGPASPIWTYTDPNFFSAFVSSAQRLANGNTLICSGFTQKRLFEVTPAGVTAWSYDYPGAGILFQAHHVERSLWIDGAELPVGGGQIGFDHLVGSPHAGQLFFLLGSISGTAPGTAVAGGVTLPLNFDFLTSAMASQWNTGIFAGTLGTLGALGEGASALVVPGGLIPPGLAGVEMNFAHLIYGPGLLAVRASNATTVTIVP